MFNLVHQTGVYCYYFKTLTVNGAHYGFCIQARKVHLSQNGVYTDRYYHPKISNSRICPFSFATASMFDSGEMATDDTRPTFVLCVGQFL